MASALALITTTLSELKAKLVIADESEKQQIMIQIEAFLSQFSSMNVSLRNQQLTNQFAENFLQTPNERVTKYTSFLASKSVCAIITAPTQVGKSNAVKDLIEVCLKQKIPCIVSSDNKTDQQDQLFSRIKNDLSGTDDIVLLKVSNRNFANRVKQCLTDKKLFVIFCLDNQSQIEKIIDILSSCASRSKFNMAQLHKMMIIHDEGDVIQKDSDTSNIHEEQAQSHQKWIELTNMFSDNLKHVNIKRVFVSATPENCCALYDIKSAHIIQLEAPGSYRGWKDIKYTPLQDDFDIKEVITEEVRRIQHDATNPTGEAILYCMERNTDSGGNNHHEVLKSLSSFLPKITIHTYNSKGITLYTTNQQLKQLLNVIDVEDITSNGSTKIVQVKATNGPSGFLQLHKSVTIRKLYSLCQEAGERVVITIGRDLINRGISYVSENKELPLIATTIIYKPGQAMHVVGDVQTIGRITGTARPDLKRRLYAPEKVIENYQNFNKNQEQFLKDIKENGDEVTSEMWKKYMFKNQLTKPLDRKTLKLKPNFEAPPLYEEYEPVVEQFKTYAEALNFSRSKGWEIRQKNLNADGFCISYIRGINGVYSLNDVLREKKQGLNNENFRYYVCYEDTNLKSTERHVIIYKCR